MKRQLGSAWAALVAWVLATLLVGGGYVAFRLLRGQAPQWVSLVEAAAAAAVYAGYLAWRTSRRSESDRGGEDGE